MSLSSQLLAQVGLLTTEHTATEKTTQNRNTQQLRQSSVLSVKQSESAKVVKMDGQRRRKTLLTDGDHCEMG